MRSPYVLVAMFCLKKIKNTKHVISNVNMNSNTVKPSHVVGIVCQKNYTKPKMRSPCMCIRGNVSPKTIKNTKHVI